MRRAAAETSIAYNLSHPNIVATYRCALGSLLQRCSHTACALVMKCDLCSHDLKSIGDKEGHSEELQSWKLYLIQELCNGGTLCNLVEVGALRAKQGGVRFDRIISLLVDIAAGMEHLHAKRIAHGDLNPNNVLLAVRVYIPQVASVCSNTVCHKER